MKPGIIEIVKQVDLALIDGTFYSSEELPGRDMSKIPHPTVVSSMQMFQQLNPVIKKRIFFTHLNHSNSLLDSDGKKLGELKEKQFNITEEMMHFRL